MQQDVQHPRTHLFLVPHGGVGGNFDLLAHGPFAAQPRPFHFQLAVIQKNLTRLAAIENHVPERRLPCCGGPPAASMADSCSTA